MPTTTEIKYPNLTYCQEYDDHCLCPKCEFFIRDGKPNGCRGCEECILLHKIFGEDEKETIKECKEFKRR
jgi:hypothetical protein